MKNFKEVIAAAAAFGPVTLAVAAPYDKNTIGAVRDARKASLIRPLLCGNAGLIRSALDEAGENPEDYETLEGRDPARVAIAAVRDGRADFLMKGKLTTSAIMSACLNKTSGLNTGRSMSAVTVCHIPAYGKLLAVSDPALNILPTTEQKIDFTASMIKLLHALGIDNPRIALLSSSEEVSMKIPSTMDAAVITQMNRRGQLAGAQVDGPLALDNIVSAAAAEKKGIHSPVAGSADGIIVPNIECGNALIKSLIYFAGSTNATLVVGGMAPVVLPSRAGSLETKLAALAVGALLARRYKEVI